MPTIHPGAVESMTQGVMFLAVTVGLPMWAFGATVYHALADWRRGTCQRILLSLAATLGWVAVMAAWSDRRSWLQWTIRTSPDFVLVAAVAFIAVRLLMPKMVWRSRILISLLLGFTFVGAVEAWTLDGFDGSLRLLLLGDHTRYAQSYSDTAFKRIEVGMTPDQVEGILGRPFGEWNVSRDGSRLNWRWTESRDGSKEYRVRVVTFLGGHVEEKSAFVHMMF